MKIFRQISLKSLSVILSVLMVFYLIPTSVYSVAIDEQEQYSADEKTNTPRDEYEVKELREESVKHFKLSDGTYVAVQYEAPVHYIDESGKWADIDNTLKGDGSKYTTPDSRVSFSKKIGENSSIFSLNNGKYRISMSINGAAKASRGVVDNSSKSFDETASQLQKQITPDKLSSKITYKNIAEGVDIEYWLDSLNVKENIIVRNRQNKYAYSFNLSLNNLVAALSDDGSVVLSDSESKETMYVIPAGYMYDADGDYSDAVKYELETIVDGIYVLTVTADSDWLNSEARSYPITIDPSVSIPNSTVTDLDISSANPDRSSPTDGTLYVSNTWRAYWKTGSLPSIPSSAYITKATISLVSTSTSGNYVGAYAVTSGWDSTLTWNKTIAASSPEGVMSNTVIDYNCINGNNCVDNRYTWDITSLYKAWVSGASSNNGVGFRIVDGTTVSGTSIFKSNDSTPVSGRPQLMVYYADMKGIESYWSYTSQSAGLAGTSYINNATGSMIISKALLSTTDSLMPYTPTMVYNSTLAATEYEYPNAQISYIGSYMPCGFKMNIQETIVKKKYTSTDNSEIYYYIWADADGTEHAFLPVNGSTTNYEDEDGLQLKLSVSGNVCSITDDSKTVKNFTKLSFNAGSDIYGGWYLSTITDKNGNKVSFTFDYGVRPTNVSLIPKNGSQIDFLTIKYNSSYVPYLIWNPSTKEAIVFRYSTTPTGSIATSSTNYLREVVYAHGNSSVTETNWLNFYNNSSSTTNITVDGKAKYTYNSSGYITKIQDELSGYEIRYTYSSNKVSTVQEYAGSSAGQKIGFSYYTGYTEVRSSGSDDVYANSDDIITRYSFDNSGRTVGVYSTDYAKTQIYGASSGIYETEDKIKNNIKTSTTVGGSATNYLLNGGFENLDSNGNAPYWTKSSSYVSYLQSYDTYGGKNGAYFSIASGRTDSICQYTKLPAGKYTLSMSVNTYNCKNVHMYVTAQSLDNSSHIYTEEVPVNDYYASGTCSFFSTDFEAANINSSGGESYKIIIKTVGGNNLSGGEVSISVDNVMLEKSIGNSQFSMIQMGNFDKFPINSSGTLLNIGAYFWISDEGNLVLGSASAPFGYTGYLSAAITKEKYLKQTVYQASDTDLASYDSHGSDYDTSAKTYIISGFAKGTGQVASPHGAFRLRADVAYYNGQNNDDVVIPYYFDFQNDCNDWQFVCGNVETAEGLLVHSITIYCEYSHQPGGYALFDNIAFIQSTDESVVKYEYYGQSIQGDQRPNNDALDGLLRTRKSGYYTEVYEYNNDRQITRIANNRGEIHDYSYATNGVDISYEVYYTSSSNIYPYLAANPDSVITKTPKTKTTYSYNSYGEVTSTDTFEVQYNSSNQIVPKTGTKHIRSSSTYNTTSGSKTFGALLQETDSLNRKTRYYYNANSGRLLACVNVNEGNGTCYTYDAVGNIVSVMPAQYVSNSSYSAVSNAESVEYEYNNRNLLDSITTDSTTYYFEYDVFGNTDSISVGSRELADYEYNSYNGKLKRINYGNGFSVRYAYDKLDNISEVWYGNNGSETKAFEYTYTAYGQLYRYDNLLTGKSVIYKYDTAGKLTNFIEYNTADMVNEFSSTIFYNDEGKIDSLFYTLDYSHATGTADHDIHYFHAYKTDGSLNYYTVDTGVTNGQIQYNYDTYKRVTGKVYDFYVKNNSSNRFKNTVSYTFSSYSDQTSAQIATYTSRVNLNTAATSTYTYDDNGNITKITLSNGQEYRYVYDDLGQLIREDNSVTNKTYVYAYDNAGNILSKKTYSLTAAGSTPSGSYTTNAYTYGDATWGDLLTKYRGVSITYDAIGNPLSYYNGSSYTFTWKNGRQLASATKGSTTLSFDYNDEGIRTKKVVNGVEHTYYLSGSQIEAEKWGNNLCIYIYDAEGAPIGMQYRNSSMAKDVFYTFWFEKNLQGDVIAVYNDSGVKVLVYTYDAWGNIYSTIWTNSTGNNIYAQYNPFRYRGYYYDSELEMYYLQSRYYDPAIGRFINADKYLAGIDGDFRGYNLFAYCLNNPVNMSDPTGNWSIWSQIFTVVAIAAITVAAVAATVATCGAAAPALAVAGGGIIGGITASTVATASSVATVALVTAGVSATAAIVTEAVEKIDYHGPIRDQSVYVMRNKASGEVQYVGRTNDPGRRQAEHEKDPKKENLLPLEVKYTGLTKTEARVMEQVLISAYSLENLSNARREIAAGNINGFAGKIDNIISIFGGSMESEIMSLMGR